MAAVNIAAHAFQGQPTIDGTPFNLFPALNVPEVRAGAIWNTVAPRVGLTYDLTGNATNVIKGSYAMYFDQRFGGQLSKALNPAGSARIDLGWTDLNGDQTVQTNEINQSLIRSVTGFDPANPAPARQHQQRRPERQGAAHARDRHRVREGNARRLRHQRQLRVAAVRPLHLERHERHHVGRLLAGDIHAAGERLSGRRAMRGGDLLRSERDAAERVHGDDPAGLRHTYNGLELVVRKRSSRGLDDDRQLFLQQHHRRLRLAGGVRGSDEHRPAQRLPVRADAAASVAVAGRTSPASRSTRSGSRS